ncbi:Gfo/Idh/MocA family oxidoreductase, partial [Candidatus Sumerlaeota bacterium]|nr:Gfo/Idh/MocA family oxidoreductase [Candidatus Sumerlaeota bacterium]
MKGKKSGLTRRAFLKSAAALSAAPCIIPATALGGEGRAAPSERIVMGGIGIGGRGTYDLRQLIAWSEVQFVADSDPRAERRANVKKLVDAHYNNEDCKLYIDFREMLAREDIDAVLIATGDRWHAMASILAMRAGKDVFCEKPCSISIAEARALADTERRYGRVYQAGTQRRSEENFVFVMELARTGRLGKLHTLTAHIVHGLSQHKWFPPEPEPPRDEFDWDLYLGPAPWRPYSRAYLQWHWHYDMHGGGLPEWGSHTFDMCQWANGADNTGPVEFEYPNNDTAEGLVAQYANGVKLVCKGGPAFPGSCGVRFTGSEGWAECSDGQPAT